LGIYLNLIAVIHSLRSATQILNYPFLSQQNSGIVCCRFISFLADRTNVTVKLLAWLSSVCL